MKVFLSYGHDSTEPLVSRIEADLRAAGHAVWRDNAKIRFTDDWRRAIIAGLADTRLVLSFLSPHAVREGGVCLDELAIALGRTHNAIATLLCVPQDQIAIPASISHPQWLDLSDWATHWNTPGWESWYQPKLAQIVATIDDPKHDAFQGEIRSLRDRLLPITQTATIGEKIEDFTGRLWLLDQVNRWRTTDRSRVFWLSGSPGTGKSAFAAWIAHFARANVAGINFSQFGVPERCDARQVIRTLAFLLATRLRDYRAMLLALPARDLAPLSAPALFDHLLAEPLATIDGGRARDRFVLVLDGLDETRDARGDSELAELLETRANTLPAWMAVLATARPEFAIPLHLDTARRLDLDEHVDDQRGDIARYAQAWFPPAVAGQVAARSAGNFLYLRLLRDALRDHGFDLTAGGVPHGLPAAYRRFFRRLFPDDASYAPFIPLLEVLAAASGPVPLEVLRALFPDWRDARIEARMLEGLGTLFRERGGLVAPFHGSVRDFLKDRQQAGAAFVVTVANGHARLAEALWARFRTLPAGTLPDGFLRGELPAQIAALHRLGEQAVLVRLLAAAGDWSALVARLIAVAQALAAAYAWDAAAAWCSALAALADPGDPAARRYALIELGDGRVTQGRLDAAMSAYRDAALAAERHAAVRPEDPVAQRNTTLPLERIGSVLVAQGNLPAALQSFRDGLAIHERLARADPGNAGWQGDLSVSYERIGSVLVAQGNLPAALQSFRDGLAIHERLARADPGNAGWQRDLSVSYERVGDVLVAQGNLPAALQSFRDGLAIRERLARADPGNAGWQRDLSVSYERVGDVLVAQGDLPAALQSFRDGLAIRERLARADPGNAGWQRDLSVSYERVGDVLVAQGDLPAALQSFRDGLAIAERLARADPGNAGWQRDLSVSYNKVGDALVAQGDMPAALQSFRDGLAIAERLARADPGNAGWQRDLSYSQTKIGQLLLQQGDRPGARAAFESALATDQLLAAMMPDNLDTQTDLLVSFRLLADLSAVLSDFAAARQLGEAALAQAGVVAARFGDDPRSRRHLASAEALRQRMAAWPR